MTCPIWLSLLFSVFFCHQVVHLFHLVFRWSRDSNPRLRTMAQIVSPRRSPLDQEDWFPFAYKLIRQPKSKMDLISFGLYRFPFQMELLVSDDNVCALPLNWHPFRNRKYIKAKLDNKSNIFFQKSWVFSQKKICRKKSDLKWVWAKIIGIRAMWHSFLKSCNRSKSRCQSRKQ